MQIVRATASAPKSSLKIVRKKKKKDPDHLQLLTSSSGVTSNQVSIGSEPGTSDKRAHLSDDERPSPPQIINKNLVKHISKKAKKVLKVDVAAGLEEFIANKNEKQPPMVNDNLSSSSDYSPGKRRNKNKKATPTSAKLEKQYNE